MLAIVLSIGVWALSNNWRHCFTVSRVGKEYLLGGPPSMHHNTLDRGSVMPQVGINSKVAEQLEYQRPITQLTRFRKWLRNCVFPQLGWLACWLASGGPERLFLYLSLFTCYIIFTFLSMSTLTIITSAFFFNELFRCMHWYGSAKYCEWCLCRLHYVLVLWWCSKTINSNF